MMIPQLPFKQEKTEDGEKVILTGPVFLSCGCGNVIARWATVQQNLVTKIPQGKPKSSRIINDWLIQNELKKKWDILNAHQYGVVVAETENGLEMVNVMDGATMKVADKVAQLIKRNKEWMASQSNN